MIITKYDLFLGHGDHAAYILQMKCFYEDIEIIMMVDGKA